MLFLSTAADGVEKPRGADCSTCGAPVVMDSLLQQQRPFSTPERASVMQVVAPSQNRAIHNGDRLHLKVQHGGQVHAFALHRRNATKGGDTSVHRFRSLEGRAPARARVSADGQVTAWFALGGAYVQMTQDGRNGATHVHEFRQRSQFLRQQQRNSVVDAPTLHEAGKTYDPALHEISEPEDPNLPLPGTGDTSGEAPVRGAPFLGDPWFPGCFPQDDERWVLEVGVLVDAAGRQRYSDWQSRVEDIVDTASIVYEDQMNIQLAIAEIRSFDEPCGEYRNFRPNLQAQLETVQTTNSYQVPGTVSTHLFSGCDDLDGYVGSFSAGLASVGCLGEPDCAGVNNFDADWGTFAHEFGHNADGLHSFEEGQGSTGGIMDYGDGKHDGEFQFNSDYRQCTMCTFLTALRKNNAVVGTAFHLASGATPSDPSDFVDLVRGCRCEEPTDTYVGHPNGRQAECSSAPRNRWCERYAWVAEDCPATCGAQMPTACSVSSGVAWEDNIPWWDISVTDNTNLCPSGYAPFESEECATQVGFWKGGGVTQGDMDGEWADEPKGCFYREDTHMLYFNRHSTGASKQGRHLVCKRTSTASTTASGSPATTTTTTTTTTTDPPTTEPPTTGDGCQTGCVFDTYGNCEDLCDVVPGECPASCGNAGSACIDSSGQCPGWANYCSNSRVTVNGIVLSEFCSCTCSSHLSLVQKDDAGLRMNFEEEKPIRR